MSDKTATNKAQLIKEYMAWIGKRRENNITNNETMLTHLPSANSES
jgi:hypothetical protein